MLSKLTSLFARFSRDEKGVTLVEYGIALILAIVVGTGALMTLSAQIGANMGEAEDNMALRTVTTTTPTAP